MAAAPPAHFPDLPPLPRPAGSSEKLGCYSQIYEAQAEVLRPADVTELELIFEDARRGGRRVTFRAGGNAFDGQSLGSDLVVSLERFDAIGDVFDDDGDDCVTVGAGATWGRILARVEPLGLVPAVMVTTEHATAGGTLSGNCLSRFSPTFGKEGGWVKRFDLLTIGGTLMTCTRPAHDASSTTWTLEERTFMAAIGGLGYLGAVVAITYKLVRAYDPTLPGETALAVRTTLTKHTTYEDLAASLVRETRHMCTREPAGALADEPEMQAIYSGLVRRLSGRQSAVVLTSTYTTERERRPLAIHQPASTGRFVSELLLRTPADWLLTLFGYHVLLRRSATYVDDLRGFTFFMDGNARVKAWGKRRGWRMPTVQQTFVVPCDPQDADRCRATLAAWLDESYAVLRKHRVRPTFSDVLFVRDREPFGLSANAGMPGFAVSHAFETANRRKLARIERALAELADLLASHPYHGRVYLVKNVFASQAALRAMYGEHAVRLLELKRELDPDRLIANDFFERAFGELASEVYADVHGPDDRP